jgi:hypothetical protein
MTPLRLADLDMKGWQELGLEVILQAVRDLNNPGLYLREKIESFEWLIKGPEDEDFLHWCDLARMDPVWVHTQVMKELKKAIKEWTSGHREYCPGNGLGRDCQESSQWECGIDWGNGDSSSNREMEDPGCDGEGSDSILPREGGRHG